MIYYTEACKSPRPEPIDRWIDLKEKIPILEDVLPQELHISYTKSS